MRPPEKGDEDLRRAFQRLPDGAPLDEAALDRVWGAISGQLPAQERQEVVDKVAEDPSWALAWRLAHHVWADSQQDDVSPGPATGRMQYLRYGALAAILFMGVGVAWMWRMPPDSEYRENDVTPGRIDSLVPEGREMRPGAFVLRWTGPPGATYEVMVSSEDLGHVHRKAGLGKAEYQVPASFLAEVPAGTKLLWKVNARLADGTVVVSPTYTAMLDRSE